MRLLLISNSYAYQGGYLDHCADEICSFFGKNVRRIVFIPFAGTDYDKYTQIVRDRFLLLGYDLESIHKSEQPSTLLRKAEAIFVGGGNTFLLLRSIYDKDLLKLLQYSLSEGIPYIGSSAGANLAGPTIQTTNDMPIVYPPSLNSLGAINFNINPHYIDYNPCSPHMGETREARIREFQIINKIPVVGLREGAMLRVEDSALYLKGSSGARLFEPGGEPKEFVPGERMDFLLNHKIL